MSYADAALLAACYMDHHGLVRHTVVMDLDGDRHYPPYDIDDLGLVRDPGRRSAPHAAATLFAPLLDLSR